MRSTTIEKAIELAKGFLDKLVGPSLNELGLLVSDNIKFWRFKNQIKILEKAKNYVEKKEISIKTIPLKILVPLIENSSLEEEVELQDKWALLLGNMVDSEANFNNHVYPHILGQISLSEFKSLEELAVSQFDFKKSFNLQLESLIKHSDDSLDCHLRIQNVREEIENIERFGFKLELDKAEISNLIRLGLISKTIPEPHITYSKSGPERKEFLRIRSRYNYAGIGFRITELGILFIESCSEKNC